MLDRQSDFATAPRLFRIQWPDGGGLQQSVFFENLGVTLFPEA